MIEFNLEAKREQEELRKAREEIKNLKAGGSFADYYNSFTKQQWSKVYFSSTTYDEVINLDDWIKIDAITS